MRVFLRALDDINSDGIDINSGDRIIVSGNVIVNCGDKGISYGFASGQIGNNFISGCKIGIAIKDGARPMLANNTIVACNYGISSYAKYSANGGYGVATNITGSVTVLEVAIDMYLHADDGRNHIGDSSSFNVITGAIQRVVVASPYGNATPPAGTNRSIRLRRMDGNRGCSSRWDQHEYDPLRTQQQFFDYVDMAD